MNSNTIICNDLSVLPDIFIEVGNHYLIIDKEYMYHEYYEENNVNESPKYILNIAFNKDLLIALIGQPFFIHFHTRFDYENKKLKFYSADPNKIIFSSIKPEEESNNSQRLVHFFNLKFINISIYYFLLLLLILF